MFSDKRKVASGCNLQLARFVAKVASGCNLPRWTLLFEILLSLVFGSDEGFKLRRLHPDATFATKPASWRLHTMQACFCKYKFCKQNYLETQVTNEGCYWMHPEVELKVASGCKFRRLHPDATFSDKVAATKVASRCNLRRWTLLSEIFFLTFKVEGCIRMQPSFLTGRNYIFLSSGVAALNLCKSHFIEMNYVHLNQK